MELWLSEFISEERTSSPLPSHRGADSIENLPNTHQGVQNEGGGELKKKDRFHKSCKELEVSSIKINIPKIQIGQFKEAETGGGDPGEGVDWKEREKWVSGGGRWWVGQF